MSKLSELINKLGGVKVSDWKAQVDRANDSASLTSPLSPSLTDSFNARALVFETDYKGADGVAHNIKITTRFRRDSADKIEIDGVAMTNVTIDEDLMGEYDSVRFQLECRYTDPNEVTDVPASGDNKVTFNSGGGQHEFRLMKSFGFGAVDGLGNLGKLLEQDQS